MRGNIVWFVTVFSSTCSTRKGCSQGYGVCLKNKMFTVCIILSYDTKCDEILKLYFNLVQVCRFLFGLILVRQGNHLVLSTSFQSFIFHIAIPCAVHSFATPVN
jgi:hypothetical protein